MTIQEINQFGYRFLGPITTAFFDEIVSKIIDEEKGKVFFLAREGFFLKQLFEHYASKFNMSGEFDTEYLLCSRAFLFKLAMLDESLIPHTLTHPYKGTVQNLLVRRYGLNGGDINYINSASPSLLEALKNDISLPGDSIKVGYLIAAVSSILKFDLEIKRDIYLNYLHDIGFHQSTNNVIDIGFSGTIQKLLSALSGERTCGHYMVTTCNAVDTEQCKFIGHFAENKTFSEGFTLLDRSLYLESILTAPHGQVIDIFKIQGKTRFGFAPKTRAQHHFGLLEQVAAGAEYYMNDTISENLQLTGAEIPNYYESLVSGLVGFPIELRSILEVDDHISGFGILNPAELFG